MDGREMLEWRRGWIPRGEQLPQPFDAWLPEADELAWIASEVVELDDLAHVPCLLLVGEPGSGKSSELCQAAKRAEERKDSDDEVLFFDLGQPATAAELKNELFAAPELVRFRASHGRLSLFLDSLDEAKVQVRKVVTLLEAQLGRLDLGRLELRVACRTFDLPQSFVEWLQRRYGNEKVRTIELAPLRRSEASAAAQAAGLDPSAFLGEVDAVGATVFATRPLTLNLLMRIIQAEGRLPARLREIYLRGLKLMAVEYDEERPPSSLSSTAALAVASRIAAATVLAGRDAGDHHALGSPGTVSLDALEGGTEVDRLIALPTEVTVDANSLREVLASALFTSRGPALGWAHRTFGDFLAAWWLASDERSIKQVGDLLLVTEQPAPRLAPELANVAGWLLTIRPDLASQLAPADAIVVAYADPASVEIEQRRELLRSILDAVGDQALAREAVRGWLPRLRYDGIAGDLASVILDGDLPDTQRVAAADAVADIRLPEATDAMIELALSTTQDTYLRTAVLNRARGLLSPAQARRLRPLALEPQIADVNDEIKGAALRICWPDVIDADELFRRLTPEKNESFLGIYAIFLREGCLQHLTTPADLLAGVRWAAALPRQWNSTRDVAVLGDMIVAKAWPLAATDHRLAEELASLVEQVARDHKPLLMTPRSFRQDDAPDDALEDDDARRAVMTVLVERVTGTEDLPDQAWRGPLSIAHARDMPWALARISTAPGPWRQFCIEMLLRNIGTDELYELRDVHAGLYAHIAWRYEPVVIDSPQAEAQRQAWDRESWTPADEDPGPSGDELEGFVRDELTAFEGGDVDAFWRLLRPLMAVEGGQIFAEYFTSDLTSSPGWARADAITRRAIVDAAAEYLELGDPEPGRWLGHSVLFYPAWAGYRALRLLWSERFDAFKGLDDDVWRRWAPIVIGWPPRYDRQADGFDETALREVRRVAPDDAREYGITWLAEHLSLGGLEDLRSDWASSGIRPSRTGWPGSWTSPTCHASAPRRW
jgi:hypothetical protein